MTGIPFRVERNGKWETVEIEDLTQQELRAVLARYDHDGLVRLVAMLCQNIGFIKELAEQTRRVSRENYSYGASSDGSSDDNDASDAPNVSDGGYDGPLPSPNP